MAAAEALTNALIVEAILKQCPDDASFPSFRLVSTLWNEVTLSLHTPRLHLHLNRSVPYRDRLGQGPFITPSKLASFPPKLLKSVTLTAHPDDDTVLPSAENLLRQIAPHIQHFSVLGAASVCKFVHNIFAKCEFDKLKTLQIIMDEKKVHNLRRRDRPHVTITPPCTLGISEKPRLLKIRYIVESKYLVGSEISEEQQTFLRQILAVSPNLEYLQVKDDYFSKLPTNFENSLKTFKFNWSIGKNKRPDLCTLQNLNVFLETVKVSLERLQLTVGFTGFRRLYDFSQFCDRFCFPRDGIRNLRWFENGVIRIFKCGVRDLEKMRKLEHLDLCEIPNEVYQRANVYVGNILRRDNACWERITNLKLCGIEDLDLLDRIGPMFPSVKRLNINVRLWIFKQGELNVFLRMIFEKLAPITALTHISVGAPFPTRFSRFVDFLEYLATSFQDVTEVRVEHCMCDGGTGDRTYQRFYDPSEVDDLQMWRFRTLVPTLLGCRDLTEFIGMDIAHRRTGLVFRRGSPFNSELR